LDSFWSLLKRGVTGTFHHGSKDYLPLYLAEFSFRFNFLTYATDYLPQRLREFVSLNAPHAGFSDLTPMLRQAAAKGLLPYFEDDTHWNAEASIGCRGHSPVHYTPNGR
jgi:hypothetical protein